jgi:hypothetical protein
LKLNGVAFPPGEVSPKLKRHQVGKEVMIEEAAQPAGVVTTDLKVFSLLMGRVALSLHAGNGPYYSISDLWIFGHFMSPPFDITGVARRLSSSRNAEGFFSARHLSQSLPAADNSSSSVLDS